MNKKIMCFALGCMVAFQVEAVFCAFAGNFTDIKGEKIEVFDVDSVFDNSSIKEPEFLQEYSESVNCSVKYFRKYINFFELKEICDQIKPLIKREQSVQKISGPAIVVGDIHGDFNSAKFYCDLFLKSDKSTSIVFLGDYIDRGKNSIEVLALLFRFKIMFPDRVYLLRGNHETSDINYFYGFKEECTKKYNYHTDQMIWSMFNEVFNFLPLVAVINNKTFCVHGGIPADPQNMSKPASLSQIYDISNSFKPNVKKSIGDQKKRSQNFIISNILWNDFCVDSKASFLPNFERKSYNIRSFGWGAVNTFLKENGFVRIVRGHQHDLTVTMGNSSGISIVRKESEEVITLFSAANFCGIENIGAGLYIDEQNNIQMIICPADYNL